MAPDTSKAHAILHTIATAPQGFVTREEMLKNGTVLDTMKVGNGLVRFLARDLGSVRKAEQALKSERAKEEAARAFLNFAIDDMVKSKSLLESDGELRIGKLNYDPIAYEMKQRKATALLNLSGGRRRAGGWTYFINPELDEVVVEKIQAQMARTGWRHGRVLLDADGKIADGKHRVEAAERLGIDWRAHAQTITNEAKLWEEVLQRNLNRWSLSKGEQAKAYARFLAMRPDLTYADKITALREGMGGVSERTQRRATAEAKAEAKQDRDEEVLAELAAGKSQRQVAEETGVSKSAVDRIAKNGLPQNGQDGRTGAPALGEAPIRVIGTCGRCQAEILEGEEYHHELEIGPYGALQKHSKNHNLMARGVVKKGLACSICGDLHDVKISHLQP